MNEYQRQRYIEEGWKNTKVRRSGSGLLEEYLEQMKDSEDAKKVAQGMRDYLKFLNEESVRLYGDKYKKNLPYW